MAPLLANEMLQKTWDLNIHKSISNMAINLNQVNTTVSSSFDHLIAWKDGSGPIDTICFTFSGFDFNGTVDGNITGLPGQKFTFKSFAL